MSLITWTGSNEEADFSTIRIVEDRILINFPEDYLMCATKWHGGTPSPNHVLMSVSNHLIAIDYLLTFAAFDDLDILDWWNIYKNQLGERIVPIALTSERGLICFNFNESKNIPTIVYWDKSSVVAVCNSFSDLLDMLF